MLFKALPALLRADPAVDWTLERPCEALDAAEEADSFALEAADAAVSLALEAASDVVEALRMVTRPTGARRSSIREAAKDMMCSEARKRNRDDRELGQWTSVESSRRRCGTKLLILSWSVRNDLIRTAPAEFRTSLPPSNLLLHQGNP